MEKKYSQVAYMRRAVKSKIEYFSILNPNKVVRAWNKHKAAKKLKTEVNNIREKKHTSIQAFLVGVLGFFILREMIDNDESQIVTEEGAEYLSAMKIRELNIGNVILEKDLIS